MLIAKPYKVKVLLSYAGPLSSVRSLILSTYNDMAYLGRKIGIVTALCVPVHQFFIKYSPFMLTPMVYHCLEDRHSRLKSM